MTATKTTKTRSCSHRHDNGAPKPSSIKTIVLQGVPTNVRFSLLSNALGFYISQAFCWSIKFVDSRYDSECIEMYAYDDSLVGRLRLTPLQSPDYGSYYKTHAGFTGFLQLYDNSGNNSDGKSKFDCAKMVSKLNRLIVEQPLLVTGWAGEVVQASEDLSFSVEEPGTLFRANNTYATANVRSNTAIEKENNHDSMLSKEKPRGENTYGSMATPAGRWQPPKSLSSHRSDHDPNCNVKTKKRNRRGMPLTTRSNNLPMGRILEEY